MACQFALFNNKFNQKFISYSDGCEWEMLSMSSLKYDPRSRELATFSITFFSSFLLLRIKK